MKRAKEWFSCSRFGLRDLQKGKSKTFLIRELVQNALDEKTTKCNITATRFDGGVTIIEVEDDSPEGFRDISHAYTLFSDTYKRSDPTKRGRFNLGEKQVISICQSAVIQTTKGRVTFDKSGERWEDKRKDYRRESGSIVNLSLKTTQAEYDELLEYANNIIVPKGVELTVNKKVIPYREPYKTFEASLTTENNVNGTFKRTIRKTQVNLFRPDANESYIFELGIPVQKISCEYSIDVQQKVPLDVSREQVPDSYLQDIFAEVLNRTYTELKPENSSNLWVRQASSDDRISKDAVTSVVKNRFGDKAAIFNPKDAISNDEALSRGFKLVSGSELSKEEWANIKNVDGLMQSSTALFGMQFVDAEEIEPTMAMKYTDALAKKIAKECLDIDIKCRFVESPKATVLAQYGNRTVTFNVTLLNKRDFFKEYITAQQIDLIIHEICHEAGGHCDKSYHESLSKVGSQLIMLALRSPRFFEEL